MKTCANCNRHDRKQVWEVDVGTNVNEYWCGGCIYSNQGIGSDY